MYIHGVSILLQFYLPGGIGGLAGMLFFRHKTQKWKFRLLIPLFVAIDAILLVSLS